MRFLLALACLSFTACQTGGDIWCGAAPLSQFSVTDKLAFTGLWEHTATVVEVDGDPALVVGAETDVRFVTFEFSEDYLVAGDATDVVLSWRVRDHYTAGFLETGEVCVVSDERPWSEKRYFRPDYSSDEREVLTGLPFTAERVEAAAYFVNPGVGDEREPRFSDDLIVVSQLYFADTGCEECGFSEVIVEHRFQRHGI